MSFKLKGLREKRAQVVAKIEQMRDALSKEERAMSAEEKEAFGKLQTDFSTVSEQIRTVEADIKALSDLAAQAEGDGGGDPEPAPEPSQNSRRIPGRQDRSGKPRGGDGDQLARNAEDHALAFQAWARAQHGLGLSRAHKEACKRTGLHPRAKEFVFKLRQQPIRKRAQSVGTTTAGGYTVAEEFSNALEMALEDYSNVRGVCDEFRTDTGANMPYPTEDDTGNTGELLAENTEVAYADDTFNSVTFGAFKFSSKGILVSHELLNDSAFNMAQILGGACGTRIGRIQGSYFTTGTGTNQPHGIVTVATAGLTTAGAAAITGAELTRLAHALDPAYRTGPKVGYMMNDLVVAYLMTLVDGEGRPLLRNSFRDPTQPPDLKLNGYNVYVNQFMTGTTAGVPVTATKHVLFGDYSKFKIRDVGTVRLRRLDERWAEKDQVGFIGFLRSDSRCVNTNAIKYLLQA